MIIQEISKAWSYFRKYGLHRTIFDRDTPFLIQFGKYGICGVLSLVIFLLVVTGAEYWFPEYLSTDLPPRTLAWHVAVVHFVAFLPSNFTAYALNRWLVFTPGRHSVARELGLFTLISFISFSLGEFLPFWLLSNFQVPKPVAHFSFVVSSAMVNFVCRKFFVFEK